MSMKNEYSKLAFVKALLESVESTTDVTHRLPAKVYFNYSISISDINEQKSILTELKKKKVISGFKLSDEDFVISKPSRSMLSNYYLKLKNKPVQETEKVTNGDIRFDVETGVISMGSKPCSIPLNTNQYFLCKALFDKGFGKTITETDIVDMADWAKDTKRSVYDAKIAVNKRIKEYLGINNFIRWKTGRVWIDYQQK